MAIFKHADRRPHGIPRAMAGVKSSGGLVLATLGFLAACSPSQPDAASRQGEAAQTPPAIAGNPANQGLDDAASAAENLVEAVLADDKVAGDKAYSALQDAMSGLSEAKLGKDAATIGALQQSVVDGWAADDRPAAAMAAVSLYSRLQQAKDWSNATVPLAVSMLDHAGFKSQLLVAQTPIDWAELSKTADEARKNLTAIETTIGDQNLKQVASGIIDHLAAGVKTKDAARVQAAAGDLLAVVDLLEQQFQRQATKAAPK